MKPFTKQQTFLSVKFSIQTCLSFIVLLLSFVSCSKTDSKRTVIWTSSAEFAQYIELFNITHPDSSAVLVYKENPAEFFSSGHEEQTPDLIVGPYLRSDKIQKHFKNVDFLFDRQLLSSSDFYEPLLNAGKKYGNQYLVPVSFNLPVVIFDSVNKNYVTDNYSLSLSQLRAISSTFNQQNAKGAYTKIGFTPTGYSDFMYLVTKLSGVDFRLEKDNVVYNREKLDRSINYLREWSVRNNTSVQTEQAFVYKYLFMPDYRQPTSGRCLFSYTTSDEFFSFINNSNEELDYRWLYDSAQIPCEDSFLMMGIYKKAKNVVGASEFMSWFFQADNQKAILERKAKSKLDTEKFGIAGGFSSLRDVSEHVLPIYYTKLLSNLPPSEMISVPQKLPANWNSYREIVVEPYIKDSLSSDARLDMNSYIKEWKKINKQ